MARALAVALVLLFGSVAPAEAATVFFYSDADQYYGWAAGYSYARSESLAHDYCVEAGGKECRFAISCDGGWSAIAFSDSSARGVGIACGFSNAHAARVVALTVCMNASRAMCWTESAFDGNAREIAADKNSLFDTTYFAQQMLFALGFLGKDDETDGVPGPRTRGAVSAFQSRLGVEADGELTIDLLWRLLNAVGGPQVLAAGLYAVDVAPNLDAISNRIYGASSQPQPERDYSEELATYAEVEQRLGLATILAMQDHPCSLPADSAAPMPPNGTGGWQVRCAEGDYTLILGDGSTIVSQGLRTITVKDGIVTMSVPSEGPSGQTPVDEPAPSAGPKSGTGRTLGH